MAKLLVVEDEKNVALALKNDLLAEGHKVQIVGDGNTAVDIALSESFDLILLDVGLPRKDGNEVCHELRLRGCDANPHANSQGR